MVTRSRRFCFRPSWWNTAGNLFRTVVLSWGAYRRRASLWPEYAQWWKEASGIAILTPIGYILVLFAMRLAPISHVAPMREMSMLFGMYFGAGS